MLHLPPPPPPPIPSAAPGAATVGRGRYSAGSSWTFWTISGSPGLGRSLDGWPPGWDLLAWSRTLATRLTFQLRGYRDLGCVALVVGAWYIGTGVRRPGHGVVAAWGSPRPSSSGCRGGPGIGSSRLPGEGGRDPSLWTQASPHLVTPPPGPYPGALALRLGRWSRGNVTSAPRSSPSFWEAARGANSGIVDANVFPATSPSAFGVAAGGHSHPASPRPSPPGRTAVCTEWGTSTRRR